MLELLVKYAKDRGLEVEPGFKPKEVRWAIVCDDDGRFPDVIELGDTEQKRNPGETFQRCPDLKQSELIAGGITRSHFLVETAEVVALYGENASDLKAIAKHTYFIKLLRDASVALPQLAAVATMLEDDRAVEGIGKRLESHRARPADKVTFKIGDAFPLNASTWHDWWRKFRKGLVRETPKTKKRKAGSASVMRCFATGELAEPLKRHWKIEGLGDVGGAKAGDVLIGFDKDAFRSYGLEGSLNAAVSELSAAAYRAALNDLIKKHGRKLAGAKVVHWFREHVPPEDDPLPWLEQEQPEEQELNAQQRARRLLESIRTGQREDLARNYFYTVTLSGQAGRVMVRDWMEGQFEELVQNINRWLDDVQVAHFFDRSRVAVYPGIERIITCLLRLRKPRQDYGDWIKPVGSERVALWHAAVRGAPIPFPVIPRLVALHKAYVLSGGLEKLEEVHRRKRDRAFHLEVSLLHTRMALMKAYHVRKGTTKGGNAMTPYLNEEHPHPAYQCGRLMAVLAQLQRRALGDVGAGIVQRYYAAASSTPALVLGRLTRTSQFHLNKLEPGLAHWYEQRIASIWGRIKDNIPRTLDLEEQSLFALGYYQQMADMRTKKSGNTAQAKEDNNE